MSRANAKAVIILLIIPLSAGCGRRAWEHSFIVRKLKAIPGVTLEGASVQDGNLGATVGYLRVNGKGPLVLEFLTLDSFEPGSSLLVSRIEGDRPRIVRFGEVKGLPPGKNLSFLEGWDVSALGGLNSLQPVHPRTVSEVTANYEQLAGFLHRWPTCPRTAAATDQHGADYRYCARRDSDGSNPLPEYPRQWDKTR